MEDETLPHLCKGVEAGNFFGPRPSIQLSCKDRKRSLSFNTVPFFRCLQADQIRSDTLRFLPGIRQ